MIFLSIRYLLAKKKQTLFTLFGILLGTAAFITISGFMLGFRGYLIEQLIDNNPHIYIQAREDFLTPHGLDTAFYHHQYDRIFWDIAPAGRKDSAMIEKPQDWISRLRADQRVQAYSAELTAPVVFSYGKSTFASTITGCNTVAQAKVTTIGKYVTQGNFDSIGSGGNRIAIGEELRKKMGVTLGQDIQVSLADEPSTSFRVMAIFETGSKQTDETAYASLEDTQRVNHTPHQINLIAVRLVDYTQARWMARNWDHLFPELTESWDQRNTNIFSIFKIQDGVRFLSIGVTLIVAGFGIYNVLNMTVMQKKKDIAILKAFGYSTSDIIRIFFFQGLILGIVGSMVGAVLGYGISRYLETIQLTVTSSTGVKMDHFMISLSLDIYVKAILCGLVASIVASVLPARTAGKMTPIQIIREGVG